MQVTLKPIYRAIKTQKALFIRCHDNLITGNGAVDYRGWGLGTEELITGGLVRLDLITGGMWDWFQTTQP